MNVLAFSDLIMQSLLKKHEALENDFAVHKNRVQDVCAQGEDILSKVSFLGAGRGYVLSCK